MQQFACVDAPNPAVYMPINGFTAVELGYQQGNAVSSMVNRLDEQPMTAMWLSLFDQIWQDPTRLEDVTTRPRYPPPPPPEGGAANTSIRITRKIRRSESTS